MIKLRKTKAIEITGVRCDNCDMEIYICDSCGDYFEPDDLVYCDEEHHYCESCKEDKWMKCPYCKDGWVSDSPWGGGYRCRICGGTGEYEKEDE